MSIEPNSHNAYRATIDALSVAYDALREGQPSVPDSLKDDYTALLTSLLNLRGKTNGVIALRQRARYPERA